MNEIISLAWDAKEILRGDFKKNKWGEIILPFVVLRRLERVLEPTKEEVLQEYKKLEKFDENLIEARLNQITKQYFHNRSQYDLDLLLADSKNIYANMKNYLRGFSENVRDVFDNFDFNTTIQELQKRKLLYKIVQHFAKADLNVETIDNHMMGTIYEELVRKTSVATNEDAGEHFTPREVIKLMTMLLFSPHSEFLRQEHLIRTIYDPAAGTGGMLSIASEYIHSLNPAVTIDVFGQELNPETYSICKSDMMLKGLDLNKIKQGNSLIRSKEDVPGDGFPYEKFHYMLSNPPFGVNWGKKYEAEIKEEADKKYKGKYGPGLPRKSDGSLLFLLHMISKMKGVEQGGSRIAIVFNSSPLFTGEAGSGESDIRKWIIENDMLEAIVALPDQLFYNTGILTYIWIVNNNKELKRRGKVHLINAVSFYEKMKTSLGQKRKYISDEQIKEIVALYEGFEENTFCKILDNEDLGYVRITVERPLKRNFKITDDRLERLNQEPAFQKLAEFPTILKEPTKGNVIETLKRIDSTKIFKDYEEFWSVVRDTFSHANFKLSPNLQKAIENALSDRDDTARPFLEKDGKPIPDTELRDYENVPLKEEIEIYFKRHVLPYVSEAWHGGGSGSSRNVVGYEIPFTRYFYKYNPLRPLEEIDAEIKQIENEIFEGIKELTK
jgi:type I restriction enzyme M protein